MSLDIREEALTPAALSEHAAIPIAFTVDRVLEVGLLDDGLGGMSLIQAAVTGPYVKDYVARPGNLGGSDSWEDAGPWRHSGSTPRSCASAR